MRSYEKFGRDKGQLSNDILERLGERGREREGSMERKG